MIYLHFSKWQSHTCYSKMFLSLLLWKIIWLNFELKYIKSIFVHILFHFFYLGHKVKKIPYPSKNPFTWIFALVSCPNYTYEVRARRFHLFRCCLHTIAKQSLPPHACSTSVVSTSSLSRYFDIMRRLVLKSSDLARCIISK